MNRDLTGYRKSYEKMHLEESDLPEAPLTLFEKWFAEVEGEGGVEEANAMTLTTIGTDGFPKGRIVLLKEYDIHGFVFYTNYESEKGKTLLENNKVCLSFFWPNLERQVIIKGEVSKVSEDQSVAYFQSRPIGSQLGAWCSRQSTIIESREMLENRIEELKKEYEGKSIPKPSFWGGYRVKPFSYEFWQGRPNRLHDRIFYSRTDEQSWSFVRLSP